MTPSELCEERARAIWIDEQRLFLEEAIDR